MPTSTAVSAFDELEWTNRFTTELPADEADPEVEPRPRQVPGVAFSRVTPVPMPDPRLLIASAEVAELVGIDLERDPLDAAQVLTGTRVPEGADPYAARYGGHQFGNWAGQLGDGRAIALGEVRAADGSRQTLQLKGVGRTPYSRGADGRAVLRSSVREFLCSEAMHHLGVPTTRALSLCTTGEQVVRDMFYDGRPEPEPGAVVCRVAPSFVRFGNFEILSALGETELLADLADHVIRADFPDLMSGAEPTAATYTAFFGEVVRTTAELMADWMRVGFVHGVMNTDNLSILGLTIDYGPYGWLEPYDHGWTPNTTDAQGRRYRYGNQPDIGLWNLVRLANALFPLIGEPEPLTDALDTYAPTFQAAYGRAMAAKIGLPVGASADGLVDELVEILSAAETDMTLFFRQLGEVDPDADDQELLAPLEVAFYREAELTDTHRGRLVGWLRRWGAALDGAGIDPRVRREAMGAVNPRFVLRNYLAQLAIDEAAEGGTSRLEELLDTLRRPFDEQPGREHLAERRPEWARQRAGCSMLSCSS